MLSDRLPHPDQGKAGAVGVAVRGGGKGNKGRYLADGTFISTEQIVEMVRDLLADSTPDGDVKRILSARFGGKGASFSKHIALARKRNRCQLDRDEITAKSDSMQQWQKLLTEAKADKRRAAANLQAAQNELTSLRKYYRETVIEGDQVLDMIRNIDAKEQSVFAAEKAFNSARYHVDKYQDRIDNMLGTKAPIKHENTNETTLSGSVEVKEASKEPLTREEGERELTEILAKMREKVVQGSEN